MKSENLPPGIYPINKPKGPTSHQVVNKIRKITGVKKVGHAGTLDPLASGVLIVAIGKEYTKQLNKILKSDKEYILTIKLGEESTTYDAEGEKITYSVKTKPTQEQIQAILNSNFTGKFDQTPPLFSAVKVKGQPAYKLARKGKAVELKPRQVTVKETEILEYKWPYLKLRVVSGSGFYARSLAHDLGKKLVCGGYLSDLARTRVGNFTLTQAIEIY